MLRRFVLLALVVSIAGVPFAARAGLDPAADEPPAGTDPPTEEPASEEPPAEEPVAEEPPDSEAVIPAGVAIAGVPVGGMTAAAATDAVQAAFDEPLEFRKGKKRWSVLPGLLGASADVEAAVASALVAPPGTSVKLPIAVDIAVVKGYVADLDQTFSRASRDAKLRLVKLKPRITKARPGFRLAKTKARKAIVQALRSGDRGRLTLPGAVLAPKVKGLGNAAIVVIRRESKKLFFYRGERLVQRFGVATGQPSYPTPIGAFEIATKWANPWWYPPPSPWAEDLEPVPPGPGNPLGTRWMGLSASFIGIHGTPDAASIGYSASHGCIRMLVPQAEWLFERVSIGTPVYIVAR